MLIVTNAKHRYETIVAKPCFSIPQQILEELDRLYLDERIEEWEGLDEVHAHTTVA